jgi:hypothetical protein
MHDKKTNIIKDLKIIRIQERCMHESNDLIKHLESLLNKVERDTEICEDERLDTASGLEEILSEIKTISAYTDNRTCLTVVSGRKNAEGDIDLWFDC